jgi:hypothetical protein
LKVGKLKRRVSGFGFRFLVEEKIRVSGFKFLVSG